MRQFFAAIVLVLLPPGAALAQSAAGERAKLYFRDAFLPHLWQDAKAVFLTPENWAWFALGGALTVAAHQYDGQVDEYWRDNDLPYPLADFGNDLFGDGLFQGAFALSILAAGWNSGDEELAAAGEVLVEAQIIQGAMINIIKPLAHKERPNKTSHQSFPSGHTGTAFCAAAVLHDRFGWELGAPAYVFAAVTGLARMDVQAHWVSDVVMGATIAMVTGYTVSRAHDDFPDEAGGKRIGAVLVPLAGDGNYGALLHLYF